jgi:hypothetical protein
MAGCGRRPARLDDLARTLVRIAFTQTARAIDQGELVRIEVEVRQHMVGVVARLGGIQQFRCERTDTYSPRPSTEHRREGRRRR